MWQIKWLRRLIRRNMAPVRVDRANVWNERLSVGYMLVAWNAFGIVCYLCYQGKADWAHYYGYKTKEEKNMRPAASWAQTLNIDKGKIIRMSGFSKIDEIEIGSGKEAPNEDQDLETL